MPITLAQLVADGRHVIAMCGNDNCAHSASLKPTDLGVPLTTEITNAGAPLVCSRCGSRSVTLRTESSREARKGRAR